MTKQYCYGEELHKKILGGINLLADYVATTLGPRGRNVILHKTGARPIITKDGVTIANFVELPGPFENVGVQIIKEAASKTHDEAGDGTTTATVLTRFLVQEIQKYIRSGVPPIELKKGMDCACEQIIDYLKEKSKHISTKEDMIHVATISANGDQTIGKLIATAIDQAGKDGAVNIQESKTSETFLDMIEGFIFAGGYCSPSFINDERRMRVYYEDCLFLITNKKLATVEEILPLLEVVARENKPLIIIAEDIEGQLLAALIMNSVRGTMKVAAVKAPFYGEERTNFLSDLAIAVGAQYITRESNISFKDVKLVQLGKAKTVEILKNKTTIVGGQTAPKELEKKVESLKVQIKATKDIKICQKIQERITRLMSGISIVYVGAATQVEMIEKKHRIEDALEAVTSAQIGGVHAGGGVPLLRAASKIKTPAHLNEEQLLGFKTVLKAANEPIRQMAINAGASPDIVVNLVKDENDNIGYNFVTSKMVDMVKVGIIDPVRVTCCALKNAVSVSSTLITTNHAIVEEK